MNTPEREPEGYVAERVRDALASDPAIGVLGVEVRISGDRLFLTGDAGTPERRAAVTATVKSLCPDHDVHNEMTVTAAEANGGEAEELS